MKYYLGEITENCLGYEFTSTFLFFCENDELDETLFNIASDFRGFEYDELDNFSNGEITHGLPSHRELSYDEYEVMSKFLPFL